MSHKQIPLVSINLTLLTVALIVVMLVLVVFTPLRFANAQTDINNSINSALSTGSVSEIKTLITLLLQRIAELSGENQTDNIIIQNTGSEDQKFCNYQWNRDLKIGDTGEDVRQLQLFLNQDSDTRISNSGFGSAGNESNYFGIRTAQAVAKFQEKNRSSILTPLGEVNGSWFFGPSTRAYIKNLCGSNDKREESKKISLTVSPSSGDAPLNVVFKVSLSGYSLPMAAEEIYYLDFGDGDVSGGFTNSDNSTINHTYTTSGTYIVRLFKQPYGQAIDMHVGTVVAKVSVKVHALVSIEKEDLKETPVVESNNSWGASDIASISTTKIGSGSESADTEFTRYYVTLKSGSSNGSGANTAATVHAFDGLAGPITDSMWNNHMLTELRKVGYTGTIAEFRAKLPSAPSTPVVSSSSWGSSSIASISTNSIDPNPQRADDEFTRYYVTLKSGSSNGSGANAAATVHAIDGLAGNATDSMWNNHMLTELRKVGYTGTISEFRAIPTNGTVKGVSTTNIAVLLGEVAKRLQELAR